jgi:hypothetical protein
MRIIKSSLFLAALTTTGFAGAALADTECTKEPKSKWKDQKAFEQSLKDQGYKIKVFKVTKGNCYEIYGWSKDGKKVEIYFNPVTGEKVKEEIDD